MSTFIRRVEIEQEFLKCNLCGTTQNQFHEPKMEEHAFEETVEGSHGHDYLRETKYHLCKPCQCRVGVLVRALDTRRESEKVAKQHFGALLEALDKLLAEP
jgi:hypothetical protein